MIYQKLFNCIHLTIACYKKKWLFKSPVIYRLFKENLKTVIANYSCSIYAYVLMPNHVHLILVLDDNTDVGKILHSIKRPFSYKALRVLEDKFPEIHTTLAYKYGKRQGFRFWTPGKGSIKNIATPIQLRKTIEYIHNNPVRSNLVENPEDWEWSSYNFHKYENNDFLPIQHFDFPL